MTVDSIGAWAIFMYDRWIDIHPEVGHCEVYARSRAYNSPWTSYTISSSVIHIRLLGLWLSARYGYHFSIFFLFQRSITLIGIISFLFNTMRPGKSTNFKISTAFILMNLSGILDIGIIDQWKITLSILGFFAAIPVYWSMYVLGPAASSQEWTFLMISTGALSVMTYTFCKYYMVTYVQIDKI